MSFDDVVDAIIARFPYWASDNVEGFAQVLYPTLPDEWTIADLCGLLDYYDAKFKRLHCSH